MLLRLGLLIAVLFTGTLAYFYLSNPIGTWNRLLQPGFGGVTVSEGFKKTVSILVGIISSAASIALLGFLVASFFRK